MARKIGICLLLSAHPANKKIRLTVIFAIIVDQHLNFLKQCEKNVMDKIFTTMSNTTTKKQSPAVPSVALVFGSRSRHIAFNGELLCETNHKSAAGGYNHGHYCSYSLDSSVFTKKRTEPDVDYKGRGGCHSTGIIAFLPLNKIEPQIIERSICKKCLHKYNRELSLHSKELAQQLKKTEQKELPSSKK